MAQVPESLSPEADLSDEIGLYHLWYLEMRLREELERGGRIGSSFSLATWQLRLFPGEIPRPGLLGQSAAQIVSSLRGYDIPVHIVSSLGHYEVPERMDEYRFVALLLDATFEAASTVAFRIKGEIQNRLHSAGRCQAGVSTFPADGADGNALIQAAFLRLGWSDSECS